MAKKIKTVDILPEYGLDGDFKQISEYDILKRNLKINNVINLINMETGSCQILPQMGARNLFMELTYSTQEEVLDTLKSIKKQIETYAKVSADVVVNESETDWDAGTLVVSIIIDNLESPITVNVNRRSGFMNVVSPNVFKN